MKLGRSLIPILLALGGLSTAGCAPGLRDLKPVLSATDSVLKASGQDATITVYPGAHHSFDNIGRQFLHLPNVDSGAACALQVASSLGPFPSDRETGQCLRKGATIAWNPEATEQARRNVRAQLAELLR